MPALSAAILNFSFQFSRLFFNRSLGRTRAIVALGRTSTAATISDNGRCRKFGKSLSGAQGTTGGRLWSDSNGKNGNYTSRTRTTWPWILGSCNHCGVMMAWSHRTWKFCEQFLRFLTIPLKLCNTADDELFGRAMLLSDHALHALIPFQSFASQKYKLRHRAHSLQLPSHTTRLSDSNFITRMLYNHNFWTVVATAGAMSCYWSRLLCLKKRWVTLSANFREKGGGSSTNDFWPQTTRVPGLSRGVVCVILRLAVLKQYRRVTDRHTHTETDKQTDRHTTMDNTRASLTPRG